MASITTETKKEGVYWGRNGSNYEATNCYATGTVAGKHDETEYAKKEYFNRSVLDSAIWSIPEKWSLKAKDPILKFGNEN